jgi:hypothetical protein
MAVANVIPLAFEVIQHIKRFGSSFCCLLGREAVRDISILLVSLKVGGDFVGESVLTTVNLLVKMHQLPARVLEEDLPLYKDDKPK